MKGALLEAGNRVAALLSERLAAHGLPADLQTVLIDGKVIIGSTHASLRASEAGTQDTAPAGLMEAGAGEVAHQALVVFAELVQEMLR